MNTFKILIWMIVGAFVTLGMYLKVYSSIKKFQNDIKNPRFKFFLVLLVMWLVIGVMVNIEDRALQDVAVLIGLVATLTVYSVFFIFKKFNGEEK